MIRVLSDERDVRLPSAIADGDALWLDRADVLRATGWTWKPEGLCRDETCMPIPRSAARSLVDGDRLDVAAFWREAGWPVVHDDAKRVWVLGTGASQRADALASGLAPDFALPDLDGRLHRLSDHRGKRVFVSTWASW